MHVECPNELCTVCDPDRQKVQDKHYTDAYPKGSVPVSDLKYKKTVDQEHEAWVWCEAHVKLIERVASRIHWAIQNRHVHIEAPERGPVCESNEKEEPSFKPLNESSSYHGIVLAHLEIEEGLISRVPQIADLLLSP